MCISRLNIGILVHTIWAKSYYQSKQPFGLFIYIINIFIPPLFFNTLNFIVMKQLFLQTSKLMKALFSVCAFVFLGALTALAQAPQAVPYQGVARTAAGAPSAL